jgi:pimeloyl-ACP methyl ester carboxylesterase
MNASLVSQAAANGHADAHRLPQVDGVRHRFIRTPRLRMHLAEAGEGDPVVLVHGWPQHWYAWRDVIQSGAATAVVVVVRMPPIRGDALI